MASLYNPSLDNPSHDNHPTLLGCDLALGETAGTVLVLGAPPGPVLRGLGACASGLTFVGEEETLEQARELLEGCSPAWLDRAEPDTGSGAIQVRPHDNLLVWDLPPDHDLLEALFQQVVDEGRIFLSVPRPEKHGVRLERLVRSACGGDLETPAHAPADRLVFYGERSAPIAGDTGEESSDCLPVSVLVDARGAGPALEELLCDVLLRQRFPPTDVFIMDRDDPDGEPLPDALFGLPHLSLSRTVLVPCGAVDPGPALNDALSGVSTPFVAAVAPGCRLAPNHLVSLGMLLEEHPDWIGVLGETGLRDHRGVIFRCEGTDFRGCAAALFRTDVLREAGGFQGEGAWATSDDFWHRVQQFGPLGALSLPLASVPEGWRL